MRKLIIALTAAAALASPLATTSASARPAEPMRQALHRCHRGLHNADSQRWYGHEVRKCDRLITRARHVTWRQEQAARQHTIIEHRRWRRHHHIR